MKRTHEFICTHHSATARDTTSFEAVKKYHISKGWGDLGYNWFITPRKTHEGRPEYKVAAACRADNMNYKAVHICLSGNFQHEVPTEFQKEQLRLLVERTCKKYNIPKANVLAHREIKNAATLCPGENLIKVIKEIRKGGLMPELKYSEAQMSDMRKQRDDNHNKYIAERDARKAEKSKYEVRIEAEEKQFKELVQELAEKLKTPQAVPKILEEIEGLVGLEDELRNKQIEIDKFNRLLLEAEKDGTISVGIVDHKHPKIMEVLGLVSYDNEGA